MASKHMARTLPSFMMVPVWREERIWRARAEAPEIAEGLESCEA
jgi:hypothetical protein